MPDQNSYAGYILGTFRELLVDCSRWYPELAKEFSRDYLRLDSAINCHGIRFVLDTMPAFRKHFDMCLSKGRLIPSNLTHFGVIKKGEVIPRLFRGLTLRVFDRNGKLKVDPDITAIRLLRQLLGVFRKLRIDANVRDRGNTVRDFYRDDMVVRRGDLTWDDRDAFSEEVEYNDTSFSGVISVDQRRATSLCLSGQDQTSIPIRGLRRVLVNLQRTADYIASTLGSFDPHEWIFRHGPGSVAGHGYGSFKYDFTRWPDRLESVFPYADFAVANYACVEVESVEKARARGFTHEHPAKMSAVPKTIKAPRLIAAEPVELQWCQQAVCSFFYSRVRRTFLSKFVDFRRQDKNASLALEASHSGSHSTIDLKSASDKVSCWHVERLFRRSSTVLRSLQATRSVWIQQKICRYSPEFHKLRKYSTMGNATTFPVQTIFFTAIALACVLTVRNLRVCDQTFRELPEGTVRVFGDDIVVPSDASGLLVDVLHALELKVNHAKSFFTGRFRESCGTDAYDGHDVTSVSIMDTPRSASPSSISSTVDVHNNLLKAGFWNTAAFLRKTASSPKYFRIREVKHGDGAFGWHTFDVPSTIGFRTRTGPKTQMREILCLGPRSVEHRAPAYGNPGLLQYFTEAAKEVTSEFSSLGYLVRRPKDKLVLRWAIC